MRRPLILLSFSWFGMDKFDDIVDVSALRWFSNSNICSQGHFTCSYFFMSMCTISLNRNSPMVSHASHRLWKIYVGPLVADPTFMFFCRDTPFADMFTTWMYKGTLGSTFMIPVAGTEHCHSMTLEMVSMSRRCSIWRLTLTAACVNGGILISRDTQEKRK